MAKELEIKKREVFVEDGIKSIMDDYVKYCRDRVESPSVRSILVYLNTEGLINEGKVFEKMVSNRVINRKPFEVVKELSSRFGIKKRSIWNYWDKIKSRNVLEP